MSIRNDLFVEAAILGLTCEGDELVAMRDSRKKLLSTKFAEDVLALLCCLKNLQRLPGCFP